MTIHTIVLLAALALPASAVPLTAILSGGADELPPYYSDVYAWFDNRTSDMATSSGLVDSWTDRKGGHVATGATTTRPTLRTDAGEPYVDFTADYLTLPVGFTLDRRNSAMFVVVRSTDTDINPFIHLGTSSTTHALYQQARELKSFGTGSNVSGEFFGESFLACSINLSASAAVLELVPHATDSFGASTAGTIAGGYIGNWNGLSFPAEKTDILTVLCYNRTLTTDEMTAVHAFLSRKYRTPPRNGTKVRIYEGDSLTFGTSSTREKDFSYPMQVYRAENTRVKFVNVAAGGKKLNTNVTATSVTTELTRNSEFATRVVIFNLGTNDIVGDNRTEAQVEGDIDTWIAAVRAADAGAVIVGLTLTDRSESGPQETVRLAVNNHILTTADFDYTVDVASDSRLDDATDTTYYTDQLHHTDLGYSVKAELVRAVLEANGL